MSDPLYPTANPDFAITNKAFGVKIPYTLEDLGAKPPPKFKTLRALVAYVEGQPKPLKLQADIAIEEFRSTLRGQRLKDFNAHYPRRGR